MRGKLIVVITMMLCSWCRLPGQGIDSMMKSRASNSDKAKYLGTYAFSISERNPDSALVIARYALRIAEKTRRGDPYAHCLNTLGWVYFRLGKNDSAKLHLANAQKTFHSVHDKNGEIRSTINLSSVLQNSGDYPGALKQLLSALQLIGSSDKSEYAVAEKMMGIIYRAQGNIPQAKYYLKDAAQIFQRLGEKKFFADAIGSLGILYHNTGDADSETYCHQIALNIYREIKNTWGIALCYENLGATYLLKQQKTQGPCLDSAFYYYQQAYLLFNQLNSPHDVAYEKLNICDVLVKKKEFSQAEKYGMEALNAFESWREAGNIQRALSLLSDIYKDTHDYQKAYEFLVRANIYADTLNIQNRDKAIADMLAKYETDKKDSIIALLNTHNALLHTQKELAEYNLNRKAIIEIFAFVLFLLLVVLAAVLLNRYKIKQRLHEMQMRNRISGDLHDDVGSSLSSILMLSNIAASANVHNPEIIRKISENSRDVIERISDIIWVTNPKFDDGENLRAKIMNYLVFVQQMPGISVNINITDEIKSTRFSMETRKNIFLIIKEAVNNILKHANATEIGLHLSVVEKRFVLEISDNGKGFESNTSFPGNGLITMQRRAQASSGTLTFDSTPGKGTRIIVNLPLPDPRYLTPKKLKKILYDEPE